MAESVASNRIWSIYEDADGTFWIGSCLPVSLDNPFASPLKKALALFTNNKRGGHSGLCLTGTSKGNTNEVVNNR